MIVVTGGAGFIGSNLIQGLNQAGYEDILVVDDLTDGRKFTNLVEAKISDYMDKHQFLTQLHNENLPTISAIFHEGACSSTTEWDGRYMLENNYEYSKQLLHFCARQQCAFIYASSAAVYGNCRQFTVEPANERPLNVYGYSKLLFDQYVRKWSKVAKHQVVGLRYFNVFGPRQSPQGAYAAVIPLFIEALLKNESPFINGDGNQSRDFTFVENAVQANIKALFTENEKAFGEAFNVAVGERFTLLELYDLIQQKVGASATAIHREERAGDIKDSLADISKAEKLMGYQPTVRFQDGIDKTIKWFKQQ